MCIKICVYVYTFMRIYIYTHVPMHVVHICIYRRVHVLAHVYENVHAYACLHTYVYVYVYVHVHAHVRLDMYRYMYMYIYGLSCVFIYDFVLISLSVTFFAYISVPTHSCVELYVYLYMLILHAYLHLCAHWCSYRYFRCLAASLAVPGVGVGGMRPHGSHKALECRMLRVESGWQGHFFQQLVIKRMSAKQRSQIKHRRPEKCFLKFGRGAQVLC